MKKNVYQLNAGVTDVTERIYINNDSTPQRERTVQETEGGKEEKN